MMGSIAWFWSAEQRLELDRGRRALGRNGGLNRGKRCDDVGIHTDVWLIEKKLHVQCILTLHRAVD